MTEKDVFRSMDEVRREFIPRPNPDREPDAYREWELEQATKRVLDSVREWIRRYREEQELYRDVKRLVEEARGNIEPTQRAIKEEE